MSEIERKVIMFASLIGCFVLLFAGFRAPTKELKKDDGPSKVPSEIMVRSTLMLVASVILLGVFTACTNFDDYRNGLCTLSELYITHIEQICFKFGWIVLFPWLLGIYNKHKQAPEKDDETTVGSQKK